MNNAKTIELKIERTIPASPADVFERWLNPKTPGTPWHMAGKLVLNAVVDGVFYMSLGGSAHYGRFLLIEQSDRIEHTWVSANTLGLESTVSVTFKLKGKVTLMTLVHSGLPDTEGGRSHEKGWNYFLDGFLGHLPKSAAT
jgi:uncharacterized protein YndB with AHSA1/START domain